MGALVVKFHAGFSWDDLLFIASAFAGVALQKYLTWQTIISLMVAVAVSSNLYIIYYINAAVVSGIFLNLAVASLFYVILKTSYAQK